jgi:hypothetical protein
LQVTEVEHLWRKRKRRQYIAIALLAGVVRRVVRKYAIPDRFLYLTSAMWSFLDSTLELPDGRVNLLGAGQPC